jgi:hypothetical protein
MSIFRFVLLSILTMSLSVSSSMAQNQAAQTPAKTPAKTPASNSVAKGQAKQTPQAPKKTEASKNTKVKVPQEAPLPADQLSIAEKVHVGHLPCELGASVQMTADERSPGYFNLQGNGYKYRMRPVTTSTGAIRLEDERAGAVWLQLANKSMLMDQKKGRRLADECVHPDQVAVANDMKINPPPALIDVSNAITPNQR